MTEKSGVILAESSSAENPVQNGDYLSVEISSVTPAKTELVRKNRTADLSILDEIFL